MLFIFYTIITIIAFSACIDDTSAFVQDEESFVSINGIYTRELNNPELYPGDAEDDYVNTFRILAFDASTGQCKSNVLYFGAAVTSTIRHKISQGTYHFVFLANEPAYTDIADKLGAITTYDDIKKISYPEAVFTSDQDIPMIAENRNVSIQADGTSLTANMRRLAVRLEVKLKAKLTDDLNAAFKGITLSNIPDRVPLIWGLPSERISGSPEYPVPTLTDYVGTAVAQDKKRTYNATEFTDALTATDQADGYIWAKKLERVIIPSNYFANREEEASGVILTVKMVDKYSPSCTLKIYSEPNAVDYRLPANSKLDFLGIIKEPLEMNITYEPWWTVNEDWKIDGSRILNVSQTSASMTNLNGVRISFWSNMPNVKVGDTVKKADGTTVPTNQIFNCLAVDANNPDPYRFYYDSTTGAGYMDLLLDGTTTTEGVNGTVKEIDALSGTYTLTLLAEDGNSKLERIIKVTINQNGLLTPFYPPGNTYSYYSGAFYRHNEKGERIITGQRPLDYSWSVTVPAAYRDWLIVSATPSFDPDAGKASPGDSEKYPVTPNPYRENGYEISGLKGRIYFRIGVKESANFVADKESKPKYGYVELKYQAGGNWHPVAKIYVRQGEAADYIYEPEETIPDQPMVGWSGGTSLTIDAKYRPLGGKKRTAAAKFSPYNLTTEKIAATAWPNYEQVAVNKARFVDYPTQAGAFFQWALNVTEESSLGTFFRRAYNPSSNPAADQFNTSEDGNKFPALWEGGDLTYTSNPAVDHKNLPAYKTTFEVCPSGYRRPTDGPTTEVAFNGEYIHPNITTTDHGSQIALSEMRVSLFYVPFAGNTSSNSNYNDIDTQGKGNGTYPPSASPSEDVNARKQLKGTKLALYADGFFDRRPLRRRLYATGTSEKNYAVYAEEPPRYNDGEVAYQGVLYHNDKTNASVFFPSAGRINNASKTIEGRGSTGYYWTSSVGPQYVGSEFIGGTGSTAYNKTINYGAWALESNYNAHSMISSYTSFGQSIRCVKD